MTLRGLVTRQTYRSGSAAAKEAASASPASGSLRHKTGAHPREIVGFYCQGVIVCRSCAYREPQIDAVIRPSDAAAKTFSCSFCERALTEAASC